MPDYYASTISGDDTANGTAQLTPKAKLAHLMKMATSGSDTIYLESTKTNPFRYVAMSRVGAASGCQALAALNLRGLNGMAYVTNGLNISQGASVPDLLDLHNIDLFSCTNVVKDYAQPTMDCIAGTYLTGTNKPITSTTLAGKTCAYFDNVAAGGYAQHAFKVLLQAGRTYSLDGLVLNYTNGGTIGSINAQMTIECISAASGSTRYWNWSTQSWQAGAASILMPNPSGGTEDDQWNRISDDYPTTNTIVPEATGEHRIMFYSNHNGATEPGAHRFGLTEVTLTDANASTYAWTDEGSGVFSLDSLTFEPSRVYITTLADWAANGVEGFNYETATEGEIPGHLNNYGITSLVDCQNEVGSWFWDSSTDTLYINLGVGANIADYHIETFALGSAHYGLYSEVPVDIVNVTYALCFRSVMIGAGGTGSIATENVNSFNCAGGIETGAGTNVIKVGKTAGISRSAADTSPTGLSVTNNAVTDAYGHFCINCADDGFQADGNSATPQIATMNLYGCVADGCGDHGISYKMVKAGDPLTPTAAGIVQNCTAVRCTGVGLHDGGTPYEDGVGNTLTVDGFVGYGNTNGDIRLYRHTSVAGETISKAYAENWAANLNAGSTGRAIAGITTLATNPFDADGITPANDGVLEGTGTQWWTGPRPVGADGEPFSNTPDVGGIQSKHSPLHPSNLSA